MEKNPEESLANSRRESVTSLQDFSDILDLSNLDLDNQETWYVCLNLTDIKSPLRLILRMVMCILVPTGFNLSQMYISVYFC